MQYMLLIYAPTDATPGPSEPAAWMAFTQELRESGALVAGDGFQGTDTATTVRVRDAETLTLHAGDPFLIPPRTSHNATGLGPDTGRCFPPTSSKSGSRWRR